MTFNSCQHTHNMTSNIVIADVPEKASREYNLPHTIKDVINEYININSSMHCTGMCRQYPSVYLSIITFNSCQHTHNITSNIVIADPKRCKGCIRSAVNTFT